MTPKKPQDNREPRTCNKCNKINSPESLFCNRCGTPLVTEALNAVEREEQEAKKFFVELYKNNEFRDWLGTKFKK
ncbi:MAG: hypothetical protein GF334_07905 [Candidatus Altiarchaeales archaeon]|nr:hypothetical protein [Candidatus Altiarchaeales archaeon]